MLTDIQKDILIGSLLGDGSLGKSNGKNYPNSGNARLKIERSYNDIAFLEWEYENFKEFCSSGIKYTEVIGNENNQKFFKKNKTYKYCSFKTRSLPEFTEFYKEWYTPKRVLPEKFELTPLIIAKWLADDGTIYVNAKNAINTVFCTDNFTKQEVERLAKMLSERYGERFYILQHGKSNPDKNWRIKCAHKSSILMFRDIDPVFNFLPRKRNQYIDYLEDDLTQTKFRTKNTKFLINPNKLKEALLSKDKISMKEILKIFDFESNNKRSVLRRKLLKYINLGYVIMEEMKNEEAPQKLYENYYTITDLGRLHIGKDSETESNLESNFGHEQLRTIIL